MKQILMALVAIILFAGCYHTGTSNPGVNNEGEDSKGFVVSIDSSEWIVKKVYMKGDVIYVLAPVGSTVSVREVNVINHKNGKSNTATIIVR